MAELEARIKRLEDLVIVLQAKTKRLEAREKVLDSRGKCHDSRIEDLERTQFSTRDVRHRFLSTYKRDILKNDDDFDRSYIMSGYQVAPSGNCKSDAELYTGFQARKDADSFENIYGLSIDTINSIDYAPTISACNKYATITAETSLNVPPAFEEAFQGFIAALKSSNYPDDYVDTMDGPFNAYSKFLKIAKEVRKKAMPARVESTV